MLGNLEGDEMSEQAYIILSCPELVCPFGWNEFGAGLAVGFIVTAVVFFAVDSWGAEL
jgi:hypothetical protein